MTETEKGEVNATKQRLAVLQFVSWKSKAETSLLSHNYSFCTGKWWRGSLACPDSLHSAGSCIARGVRDLDYSGGETGNYFGVAQLFPTAYSKLAS